MVPMAIRPRTPLRTFHGPTSEGGDKAYSGILRDAMSEAAHAPRDTLTHGFHSYPARMHPEIARILIPEFTRQDEIVLDPFCGSGTVLLEARVAHRQSFGVDLNPLGLRLSEVKCRAMDDDARARFLETATEIREKSEERVRSRTASRAPLPKSEVHWYDGHVLRELAGLWEEINAVEREDDRFAFEIVLSSLVVKFSRQTSDTNDEPAIKRIRKGLASEFFLRKCEELVERWYALFQDLAEDSTPPRLFHGDARNLAQLMPRGVKANFVLTSPPYGGTYDYYEHHRRRFAWLGLDARMLRENEIGARRNSSSAKAGLKAWDDELLAVLRSISSVLVSGGHAVLLIGDADIAGVRVEADTQIADMAEDARLVPVAYANQPRQDWTGAEARREHLLLLRRE